MQRLIAAALFALLSAIGLSTSAFAQATFTAKDAAGATQTFKSINCSATICPLSVLTDTTGAAIYGTAGTANVNILTVQGIASMTPFLTTTTLNAETTKVIGTVRALGNAGAIFDGATGAAVPANVLYLGMNNGGNLLGLIGTSSGLKVDGSAVTQPISAASLPLPTGAGTAANQATIHSDLVTLNTTAGAAIAAGENHIGEIASNQIKVQVAQTVTAASAYASGNAIGGLMTIAGAARVSGALGAAGTGGILAGLTMNSKSLQTTQVDIFLFDANPSGSTCTDKTAFSLATADFDKVIGVVTIPGTAANGAGWYAGTVGSAGIATYYPVTYDLSSATSIFACAVTRGTPTYTATTDVSFKFNILRN